MKSDAWAPWFHRLQRCGQTISQAAPQTSQVYSKPVMEDPLTWLVSVLIGWAWGILMRTWMSFAKHCFPPIVFSTPVRSRLFMVLYPSWHRRQNLDCAVRCYCFKGAYVETWKAERTLLSRVNDWIVVFILTNGWFRHCSGRNARLWHIFHTEQIGVLSVRNMVPHYLGTVVWNPRANWGTRISEALWVFRDLYFFEIWYHII